MGGRAPRRLWLPVAALVSIAALAGLAQARGGSSAHGPARPVVSLPCAALFYDRPGTPDLVVVSDLPLHAFFKAEVKDMVRAIRLELRARGFRAGRYRIGYRSCDDSTAQAGRWTSGRCAANARGYAQKRAVIAVIGTYNSGCAEIEIPIANRAPGGPLAMISPSNTYMGLTHAGPGTAPGEPQSFYPTGKRNYARVVAADDYQGAAGALLARELHFHRIFVLDDKEAYGIGVAASFRRAAQRLGLDVVGVGHWDGASGNYTALVATVHATGAEAVYLGGLECENGSKLIKDLHALMGPAFPLIAPDGFSNFRDTFRNSGGTAAGMFVSVVGYSNGALPPAGKAFVARFRRATGRVPAPSAANAAQALDVVVGAIAASNGTRASVTRKLLARHVSGGILGTFSFDANGDTTSNPVTQYRLEPPGKAAVFATIVPPASLVQP